jgi:hypothetical protein
VSKHDITRRPKATAGDAAHAVARVGLSMIPYVGGAAAELFNWLLAEPLVRRRGEWIESLAQRLLELEERVENLKLEDLKDNETFVSVALQASQIAIRTHQQEKLEALRNAVLNAALPSAPEDEQQLIFLSLVDYFVPGHLRLLKYLDDPRLWCDAHQVDHRRFRSSSPSLLLELALPEFHDRRAFYDQFVKELFARGLVRVEELHTVVTVEDMVAPFTSELGRNFVAYISDPLARLDRADAEATQ